MGDEGDGKSYKWSSSEATDKNWSTRAAWWAAEEWQSTKVGGGDMSPKRTEGTRGVWFVENKRVRLGKEGTEGGCGERSHEQQHEKVHGRDGRTCDSEERMSGRQPRSRRRPTPRSIWDVNEYTEKVRRQEHTLEKKALRGW